MGSVSSQLQDMCRLVKQRFKKVDEEFSRLGKVDSKSRRPSIADVLTGKIIVWDCFCSLVIESVCIILAV